jgi:nicotinamidase-related amidase
MNTALLLIDIQNDYFAGGKSALEGSLEASVKAQELLAFFRERQWPIIHIQHVSIRPARFFLPDTEGVNIHPNVTPLPDEKLIVKHYPNSFRETPLLEYLQQQQIQRLVICGMMTHMCVHAATRAAADYGFECLVTHDACATKALSFQGKIVPAEMVHAAFLAALSGAYARVLSVAEVVQQLQAAETV